MTTQATGTIVAGAIKLDIPINLPDNSRVRVAIEPLEVATSKRREALKEWIAFCEQHPVHSGGLRYTRDELHERR